MRLIDADTVCKKLEGYARDCEEADDRVAGGVFLDAISEIQDTPTIDPKDLQPRGRWNDINPAVLNPGIAWVCRCSLCGCPQDHKHNYCPNCGARMEGRNDS